MVVSIFIACVTGCSFTYVAYLLWQTARHGRQTKKDASRTNVHRRYATQTILFTIIAVVLVEALIHWTGNRHHTVLFWIHLPCAVTFLVLLIILRLHITGLEKPIIHKWLAYICSGAYAITYVTGMTLLVLLVLSQKIPAKAGYFFIT